MGNCVAFVLAAGQSSRMKSSIPKVFLPLGGRDVLDYILEVAHHWAEEDVYCVLSPSSAPYRKKASYHTVIQEKPLGTGDAFKIAFQKALRQDPLLLTKNILVLLGDTPLVRAQDMSPLMEFMESPPEKLDPEIVVMGMRPPDPGTYGRLVVDPHINKKLACIVEAKEASPQQLSISLCNTGVMLIKARRMPELLTCLQPSLRTGEYYLTDLIEYAHHVGVVEGDWQIFTGINTRQQLCEAEQLLQQRLRQEAIEKGAFLMAPETTFFSYDTRVDSDVVIHPFTTFGPQVILERGATILPFCVLAGCHIQENARVGPFAHIRAGTSLGPESHIGNFVEVKNTKVGYASKAKHLSYLGDATLGDSVNIGAGVITCNYDGLSKHVTQIGSGSSIGAHSALIAPLIIGEDSTIGAGSVITKDVPDKNLAVARSEQKNIALPSHSKHLARKKKNPRSK